MAWRKRTLGDGLLARVLLPDDYAGVAFRAALVLSLIIITTRGAAGH